VTRREDGLSLTDWSTIALSAEIWAKMTPAQVAEAQARLDCQDERILGREGPYAGDIIHPAQIDYMPAIWDRAAGNAGPRSLRCNGCPALEQLGKLSSEFRL